MTEALQVTVARIEEKLTAHNLLCDDRWKRIERIGYAIAGLLFSLLVVAVQHFWK